MNNKAEVMTKPSPTDTLTVSGILQRKCACGQHTIAGGECDGCGKKDPLLQRATRNSETETQKSGVPQIVHQVLRSPGHSLDTATRAFFEPRFGHDFSQVRVHTDANAAESSRSVNALAYTVGQDVVFGAGQYAPGTSVGRKVLAHELTHVVQQRFGKSEVSGHTLSNNSDYETEANDIANDLVTDTFKVRAPVIATGNIVARQKDSDELPKIERSFELDPGMFVKPMNAPAERECDVGSELEPSTQKCVPSKRCTAFDREQARQFAIQKLSQAGGFAPRWAAAIQNGPLASLFPPRLSAELNAGAKAVTAKLSSGTISIKCDWSVGSHVGSYLPLNEIQLAMFISPPWSQKLINRVTLHECLHAVLNHLPSSPGRDPYNRAPEFGFDTSEAMHSDVLSIMTAFPDNTPKW